MSRQEDVALLSKGPALAAIGAVLLAAGCTGHAHKNGGSGQSPAVSATPSPLSSAAALAQLTAIRAGDEGTFSGIGPRTFAAKLRRASSLTFGCIGTGPLQLDYSVPGGAFRARCLPTSPTNFTTNLTLPRYPARVTIRVQVEAGTAWRLALDTHLIEVVNP